MTSSDFQLPELEKADCFPPPNDDQIPGSTGGNRLMIIRYPCYVVGCLRIVGATCP